ncbi:MAG: arylsulfatase [Candidatus Latescibacterota bacterium]|nr:arylsulfatase [Candidatus Latescibacterota bacterium]
MEQPEPHRPQRPNIVFVLTDDQGYGDLGCHGNEVIRTPHLDHFHGQAVRFTDYHVGSTCAPTRSGILTGHYCNSAGVWHTIGGRSLLREAEWTLADALRAVGYRTGHFGKWHLGDSPPYRPHERGFEESIYHAGGGIGNTGDPWGNDYFDDTYFHNGEPTPYTGYCTDVFFREGMRFIAEHAHEPFFCYIATNAPHGPLNVEPQYINPYRDSTPHEDRARFYGMITNIDDNFGRLCRHLDQLGISEDTIVIFMTDNGTATGVELDELSFPLESPGSFNANMRGKKGSHYEGGHRVPFFLRYPAGGHEGGLDIPELSSYVDVMPTLLELCDVSIPTGHTLHGRSLVSLLEGRAPDLDWETRVTVCDTQRVARPVKWRRSSTMQGSWRLISGRELYDLSTDPGQRHDIADAHPQRVAQMRTAYQEWWELVSDQFDRDVPIALGQDESVPAKLTTHDLRNESCSVAWNQRQVRQGMVTSGYWEVDVRCAGDYEIELRRWPEETGYALRAGIDGDDSGWRRDCIKADDAPAYEGGRAIDLRWGQLAIGNQNYQMEIENGALGAMFRVRLEPGPDQLFAALYDRLDRTLAPYYVYVRRLPQ